MTPGHEPSHLVTAVRDVMRDVTGDVYEGCPWRVFTDPYVHDVLNAYRWFESGQVALSFGTIDGPNIIVEGVGHYHATLNRLRLDDMERSAKARKARAGAVQTVAAHELRLIGDE